MSATAQSVNQTTVNASSQGKNSVLSYVLWFFLCSFGAHRLYLERPKTGIAQALLFIFGVILSTVVIGIPLLIAWIVWVIVDLFSIHKWVAEINNRLGVDESSLTFGKSQSNLNKLEELEKLHNLFEKGVLTQAEYDSRRATLI